MARLNDDAQWIILMGFLVSFSLFFMALIINQSTVVGQSTSESVIEFPKNDIRDISHIIKVHAEHNGEVYDRTYYDIVNLSMIRKGAIVNYTLNTRHFQTLDSHNYSRIHYNNGVTSYYENWTSE